MDHLHDTNLITIEGVELPEFVKIANESPKLFAYTDGFSSYFPIDTSSNTYLSALFFEKNAHTLNDADYAATHNRILEALSIHSISYTSPFSHEKIASDNGYTFEKLANEVQVFEDNCKFLSPSERHEKAKEIRHRYNVLREAYNNIPSVITKNIEDYSGDHLKHSWRDDIRNRGVKVNNVELKNTYKELSESDESKDIILKILSKLDERAGLDKYYDKGVDDPFRLLLTNDEPKREKIIIMIVNGKSYSDEDIDRLNPLDVSHRFGGDILTQLFSDKINYLRSAPEFVKIAVAEALDA